MKRKINVKLHVRDVVFSNLCSYYFIFPILSVEKAIWATRINKDWEGKGGTGGRHISNVLLLGLTKEFNKLNFPINAIENLMSFLIHDFTRLGL